MGWIKAQRRPFTTHLSKRGTYTNMLSLRNWYQGFVFGKTKSFVFSMAATAAFSTGSPNSYTVKRVGTHNGSFHCDEALGCFMIRLTEKFAGAEIVRTRDPQAWSFSCQFFSFFLEKLFCFCTAKRWWKKMSVKDGSFLIPYRRRTIRRGFLPLTW